MIATAMRIAYDHQDGLRAEAAVRRQFATASRPSLRDRLASATRTVRSAFGRVDIAPGSVFPAIH